MQVAVDWAAAASDYKKNGTVRVLAQGAQDRTPAECAWCAQYSARVAETCASSWCPRHSARAGDTCCWGLNMWRDGVAGAVVGFDCYLRFHVAVALATFCKRSRRLSLHQRSLPHPHRRRRRPSDLAAVTSILYLITSGCRGRAAPSSRRHKEGCAALEKDPRPVGRVTSDLRWCLWGTS